MNQKGMKNTILRMKLKLIVAMMLKFLDFAVSNFTTIAKQCVVLNCFFDASLIMIASMAMRIFRSFMKQNTIGVIPKAGYRNDVNQSVIGTMWL